MANISQFVLPVLNEDTGQIQSQTFNIAGSGGGGGGGEDSVHYTLFSPNHSMAIKNSFFGYGYLANARLSTPFNNGNYENSLILNNNGRIDILDRYTFNKDIDLSKYYYSQSGTSDSSVLSCFYFFNSNIILNDVQNGLYYPDIFKFQHCYSYNKPLHYDLLINADRAINLSIFNATIMNNCYSFNSPIYVNCNFVEYNHTYLNHNINIIQIVGGYPLINSMGSYNSPFYFNIFGNLSDIIWLLLDNTSTSGVLQPKINCSGIRKGLDVHFDINFYNTNVNFMSYPSSFLSTSHTNFYFNAKIKKLNAISNYVSKSISMNYDVMVNYFLKYEIDNLYISDTVTSTVLFTDVFVSKDIYVGNYIDEQKIEMNLSVNNSYCIYSFRNLIHVSNTYSYKRNVGLNEFKIITNIKNCDFGNSLINFQGLANINVYSSSQTGDAYPLIIKNLVFEGTLVNNLKIDFYNAFHFNTPYSGRYLDESNIYFNYRKIDNDTSFVNINIRNFIMGSTSPCNLNFFMTKDFFDLCKFEDLMRITNFFTIYNANARADGNGYEYISGGKHINLFNNL